MAHAISDSRHPTEHTIRLEDVKDTVAGVRWRLDEQKPKGVMGVYGDGQGAWPFNRMSASKKE